MVKDPALISLLGRSKFVDMVVFGVVGWQPGVSHIFVVLFAKIQVLGLFYCSNLPTGTYSYLIYVARVLDFYGLGFLLLRVA